MTATNVKSTWSGGDLYFYDKSGNEIFNIDGTNRAFEIPSGSTATIAGTLNVSGTPQIGGTAVTATATELNESFLTLDIADGSAEAVYYLLSPHAGTISKIWTVTDAAVATADITITAAIAATPVTDGVVTIATSGSAAGDIDSATPSAANTLTAGQAVNFTVTGGGAGGTPRIHLVMVVTR